MFLLISTFLFLIFLLSLNFVYFKIQVKKIEEDMNFLNKSFKEKISVDNALLSTFTDSISSLEENTKSLEKDFLYLSDNFLKFQGDVQSFIELVLEFTEVVNSESKSKSVNPFDLKKNKKDPPKSN